MQQPPQQLPQQPPQQPPEETLPQELLPSEFSEYIPDVLETHALMVATALVALPLATALGAVLAFRPKRQDR
jgi:hypothetical protein